MSEQLIASLNSTVQRLERELSEVRSEAKKYRQSRTELKTELDSARKTIDELNAAKNEWESKAKATPTEQADKIRDLEAQVKSHAVRAKFVDAGLDLADGVKIDGLLRYHGFDPASVDVDTLNVPELVKGWKESSPALFKSSAVSPDSSSALAGAKRPVLQVETPVGRGGPDKSNARVTYTLHDVREAGWQSRRPELVEALTKGTAVLVE